MTEVLRAAGDESTQVSSVGRDGFSPYGQTEWTLEAQHRFMAALAGGCVGEPASRRTGPRPDGPGDLRPLGPRLRRRARPLEGRLGPGTDGRYLVRQMGVIETSSRAAGGHPGGHRLRRQLRVRTGARHQAGELGRRQRGAGRRPRRRLLSAAPRGRCCRRCRPPGSSPAQDIEIVLLVAGLKAATVPAPLCLPYSAALTLRAKSQVVFELAVIPPPQLPLFAGVCCPAPGWSRRSTPVVVPPPLRCSLTSLLQLPEALLLAALVLGLVADALLATLNRCSSSRSRAQTRAGERSRGAAASQASHRRPRLRPITRLALEQLRRSPAPARPGGPAPAGRGPSRRRPASSSCS